LNTGSSATDDRGISPSSEDRYEQFVRDVAESLALKGTDLRDAIAHPYEVLLVAVADAAVAREVLASSTRERETLETAVREFYAAEKNIADSSFASEDVLIAAYRRHENADNALRVFASSLSGALEVAGYPQADFDPPRCATRRNGVQCVLQARHATVCCFATYVVVNTIAGDLRAKGLGFMPCRCGHDQASHNQLKFNCLATTDGTHATRCQCKAYLFAGLP
jgi:hypothetical protein